MMWWGIALIAVALLLFMLEIIFPSGGILGIGSVVAAIAGVVCLFRFDTAFGLTGMAVTLLAAPFLIALGLKVLPYTPMFQWMVLKDEPTDETQSAEAPPIESAVGKHGEAVTTLRPVGVCRIDGQRMDCIAVGGEIEAGEQIEVVSVDGPSLRVKRLEA